jgi:hypothetical protein
MSRVSFILANASGRPLVCFETLAEAQTYRARVETDRARFQILRQTIVEERVS